MKEFRWLLSSAKVWLGLASWMARTRECEAVRLLTLDGTCSNRNSYEQVLGGVQCNLQYQPRMRCQ
jgi:hypothetical protein